MPSWIAEMVRLRGDGHDFATSVSHGVGGRRLYGGLIAAQSLAAAAATVDPSRLPQSLHAYYIKGGKADVDIEFTVERTRDGRSFDTRRVTAVQNGAAIFEMLASFHRPEATTDWQRTEPPGLALADATVADSHARALGRPLRRADRPRRPPGLAEPAVLVPHPRAHRRRPSAAGLRD